MKNRKYYDLKPKGWFEMRMNFSQNIVVKDKCDHGIKVNDIVMHRNFSKKKTQEGKPILYRVKEINGDQANVELLEDLVIIRSAFNFPIADLVTLKKIKKS